MAYISGPAILKIGSSAFYYFKDGINEERVVELDGAQDDIWGTVAQHVKSVSFKLSGVPTAMRRNMSTMFPYTKASIGASIFSPACVLYTQGGKSYTYGRAALVKSPTLHVSATKDLFGDAMEFLAIGKLGEAATSAGHFLTIASISFPDGVFDHTKIKRYRPTAAWGSSPYDAMTTLDGFQFSANYKMENIMDDNIGFGDVILTDLEVMAKFTPSSGGLTEAQFDTLCQNDGATVLQPGDVIGSAGTDLIITAGATSDGFTITMPDAGVTNAKRTFQSGKPRFGEIEMRSRLPFTAGAAGALFTIAEL